MRLISLLICFLYSLICSAQVIENPVFDRTDIPQFHIDRIEMTKDTTFVYCSCSAEENSWANISSDTYIEDIATGKKYKIIKSDGLPFAPDVRKFVFAEKYTIKLSFPFLKSANKLNFIENPNEESFNIYGISLIESNDTILKHSSIEKANALSTSASYYYSIKNYNKAIESEEKAMHIRKYWLGRYNEMYDFSVYMLGHYYSMIGKYDEAEKYLSESVNIREILYGKDKEPYVDALTMLATSYANQDKVTKAIQTYEQAISFIEKNNNSYTRAKSLLARAYFSIGDIPKAIEYTEDVVRINKVLVGEKDEEYLYPLFDLAKWYMWTNITKSKSICEDLVSIIKPNYGRKHPLYLYTINLLSQYYMLQNDGENALTYAKESMELSSEIFGNRSVEYGLSLNLMYQIYDTLLHDYDKAIQYQLDYISITKSEMGFDTYSNSLRHVANSFAKKEDYVNALRYASDAINAFKDNVIPEFGKMSNEQKYSVWQKGHFYYDTGYPFYVFMNQNDASLKDMYDNTLFFKGITLNEHLNENYTWDNIRESLRTNDIAIEFVVSHEHDSLFCYYALIIKKEYESPKMFRLFDTSQFKELLDKLLPAFELKRHLGTLIWGSINEELVDVKNIYFSPAGLFHEISIEYLPINQIENYSDKYNMYRVSSTRELIQIVPHNHYTNAVLYGGIDYDIDENTPSKDNPSFRSGFDFLLNTEEEVSDISLLLNDNGVNTIIYKGQEGSESVFYSLPLKQIDILHMATHGQSIKSDEVDKIKEKDNLTFLEKNNIKNFDYEKNVLSWSFLVLAGGNKLFSRSFIPTGAEDGLLTAKEISMMKFNNLDLVVLSACETAQGTLGYDDSVLGLQKAFKRAGANTILMSLDKVDDEATKILMVEFYRNLMDGKTKHQSLKDAQKHLRQVDNGRYDKPKYWALFIMLDGLN